MTFLDTDMDTNEMITILSIRRALYTVCVIGITNMARDPKQNDCEINR